MADKIYEQWWLNQSSKLFQLSDRNGGIWTPPHFYKYEIRPVEIYILLPDPLNPARSWNRQEVDNVALRVALNDSTDTATPKAETTSWTKDTTENCFRGDLNLNTSLMNTYVDADSKDIYLEVSYTEPGGSFDSRVILYLAQMNIKRGVAQATTTNPDPAKDYVERGELGGQYVTFIMPAGQTLTLKSPNGNRSRTLGIDNDGNYFDIPA